MKALLAPLTKLFGASALLKFLFLNYVLDQANKAPSGVEAALTVKDTDVVEICTRVGIKNQLNINKVRNAFRAFAKAGGDVVRAINDALTDERVS